MCYNNKRKINMAFIIEIEGTDGAGKNQSKNLLNIGEKA